MLENYFKIAIRQLRKQKMYSAIKILGFALGIAACLLIALFIRNELSYDSSYPNAKRIYRLIGVSHENGITFKGTSTPAPMMKALKADFPEIENAGRLMPNTLFDGAGSNYISIAENNNKTFEQRFTYADQEILDILELPMVYGRREYALSRPNSIVMSRRKAEKYFPGQNPVGKVIYLNDNRTKPYTIGGIIENFPATSHLQFDFLITLTGKEFWPGEQASWQASNYDNYILLKPGTDIRSFEKKLTSDILRNYAIPSLIASGNKDAERIATSASLTLQPISAIHLNSYDIEDTHVDNNGDIRFIWLFGAIAGFILIIACINFINLSTAKSANRAKEVGLRKVVGSLRTSLVKQFLVESLLFSMLSFAAGLIIAGLMLPYFNVVSGRSLSIPWTEWWLLPVILISAIIIGIIAGLYPSFYLSSFKPIQVLKGGVSKGSKNAGLRNALVVFQFTTSIVLIIGTLVIYKQMQYIMNSKLGFDKDMVLLIDGAGTLGNQAKQFRNELLKISEVKAAAVGDYLPVSNTKRNGNQFWKEGKVTQDVPVSGQFWIIDDNYLNTMGIKIKEGRNFSSSNLADSQRVIINEKLANDLNLSDPVGKRITNGGGTFEVVGVVENFNFESLRQTVEPLCLQLGSSPSIVSVKISTGNVSKTISAVTEVWKSFVPGQAIRYDFLDERIAAMYTDVQRTGKIFSGFSILAIIVACLGLFALSAFMAEQRSKEIGIRKVLGATTSSITGLLSKNFLSLVAISIVIASPIAWWAMTKWLQDFTYRTPIHWWIFIVAGLLAVLIALVTVSFQSIKAALTNPVKTLRSE